MSKLDSYQLMYRTVGEVAAGIAALVLKNNLQAVIDDKMKHGMLNYGTPGYEGMTETWDLIQVHNLCGPKFVLKVHNFFI